MKESRVTGITIYQEMNKLYKEKEELAKALYVLEDDLGTNHIAYKIMNQQVKDAQQKLEDAGNREYTKVTAASLF